jgi:hypothetical protein
MAEHVVKWFSAAPFWSVSPQETDAARAGRFARPAILRFASDDFMEQFLATLERDPAELRRRAVVEETWRNPPGAAPIEAPPPEGLPQQAVALSRLRAALERRAGRLGFSPLPQHARDNRYKLKLYQPAHQRYYLVAATLACEMVGFPDRAIDPAMQERSCFVLRRLFPKDPARLLPDAALPDYVPAQEEGADASARAWEEYAFVVEGTPRWVKVPAGTAGAMPLEERLPLFPANYAADDGRTRRLLSGLIPTGRREAYFGAPRLAASGGGAGTQLGGTDPRIALLRSTVLEPWKALIARSAAAAKADTVDPQVNGSAPLGTTAERRRTARGHVQLNSWLLLVDLVDFLHKNLPPVLDALRAQDFTGTGAAADLARALQALSVDTALLNEIAPAASGAQPQSAYRSSAPATLAAAIRSMALFLDVTGNREALEAHIAGFDFPLPRATTVDSGWPGFLFLFADITGKHVLPSASLGTERGETENEMQQSRVEFLLRPFGAALGVPMRTDLPLSEAEVQAAPDMREGWFVARCIYERPECGPLHPSIVSAPTQAFQIAGFFDPDAPARAIRIGLPIDTTPAGLRKFDKKTMFMVSNILCGQIDRMKALTLGDLVRQILPWPLHKDIDLPERGPCATGLMCSLSIPIVTICALILLMIIVSILDFIFKRLPYLLVCLPIPGFKGKK